jgi:hypothetical protein
MGKPGDGYGSEYHLRHLLRHSPTVLTQVIGQAVASSLDIMWLPYPPRRTRPDVDREMTGIEFLGA